jgi:hypothetical protein
VSAFQVMTAKSGSLYISDKTSSIVVWGTKDEVQTEIANLRVALQAASNNVALWPK